ncbi:outer membrane protein [Oscillatoria acuminata PCC 6304]|uniref:Outer membrane protein n=2 Tax=Oscillatoria acuminata TaxID=118323 RepID=K9TE58_9CYAN|nr:outer membrane protein [Oscillatoria acuminata PCC 6304]
MAICYTLKSVGLNLEVLLNCKPNQKLMGTFRSVITVGMGTLIALSDIGASLGQTEASGDRLPSPTPETAASSGETRDRTAPTEGLQAQGVTPRVENVPEYLTPNPNPLQFPTERDEVEILGTQPLTLEQALQIAEQNSQQLQEALLTVDRNRAALREARAALYPNLGVQSSLSRSSSTGADLANQRQRQQLGDNAPPAEGGNTSLDGGVELTYNLYNSGRRSGQIGLAETQLLVSELDLERVLADLRLEVREAYYNLQESDDQIDISLSAVQSSEQSLRDAEALERAGLGTRFDVLRARVQLADASQALIQAQAQQRIRRREISRILNVSQVVDISAAEPVEISGLWNLSLEDSIVLALRNRAELEQLLLQRELTDYQRQIALSALGPQVNLFASYNVVEVFGDDLNLADGYNVGGRVQWNLYDGGAARARAVQEERNIEIAETRFGQFRNQVRLQVEQAYFNLRSNFENIQTSNIAVDQARESLRLARLRFQAGVGTQTDVLTAETELTRAQNNRLRAIVTYNRALASMERAIGNVNEGLISTP